MNKQNLKKQMAHGMFWKFAERFIAQGVSFFVSLVLARLLVPEDYGVVSIINMFILIADVLLNSGLTSALIQKKDTTELEFSTIFYCNLLFSCFLYIIFFALAPFLADAYNMPILVLAIRIFALRLPISAFQSIQVVYVSKKMEFRKFFMATIIGTIISAIIGIYMAIYGMGVWALIAQYLSNTLINTIMLWITVKWYPKKQFSWKAAIPLIEYGWKVMMTDFLGTICNNLGSFIIGLKYTSADLAFYDKGKQLPMLFRSNVYNTLISVLFPGMSNVNDNLLEVKKLSRKSLKIISYIIFPIMFGTIATAKALIIVLYTEKWLLMLPFVYIVCIETVISVPGTITLQAIKSVGRSDLMLKTELFKKIFFILSIIIAIKFGIFAIAVTLPLNTLVDLVINGVIVRRVIDYKLIEQLKDCLSAFILSCIMCLIVSLMQLSGLSIFLTLILQVIVGIFVYIVLSIITKNEAFMYILDAIKNIRGN